MNWSNHFARRTHAMKRTAVREALKLAARPEVISFAGGLPAAELYPIERVKAATATVLDRCGGAALQYGETEGLAALRDWLAGRFSSGTVALTRENVLITSGAQQGLDLLGRVLLDEGDHVWVENPTYLALLSAWRPLGVEFSAVTWAGSQMHLESQKPKMHPIPKLIYLVPNFQNPQGSTLSREQRETLLLTARRLRTPIIEDNPYGELRYEGEPLPDLLELDSTGRSLNESCVIYAGTFSKVLMPGLRVGWVIAARDVIEKLVQAKQAADLHTSTLSQHLALELISQGFLEEFLPLLRRTYRERRDAMLAALARNFPAEVSWTHPEGGMFLLLTLPSNMDAAQLLPQALEAGVAFVPGEEFHLGGQGKNTMRLNFSNARPDQIEIGLSKLARVVRRCYPGEKTYSQEAPVKMPRELAVSAELDHE